MDLAGRIFARDTPAAGRLLTWIEDGDPRAVEAMKAIYPRSGAVPVVGLTGPPGAGKSTLADSLVAHYRSRDIVVGVLAVDPSSPFTGGAVLGDRVRMQRHAADPGVFIRSMANRGRAGGMSPAAAAAARVLEAWGCGIVIVETVGAGQGEIEVSSVASTIVLVCAPWGGDRVQAIKAGITEIADIIVLNKSDLADAPRAARALEMMLALAPRAGWKVPLVRTIATSGTGTGDLAAMIDAHGRFAAEGGDAGRKRRAQLRASLEGLVREKLFDRFAARADAGREIEARVKSMIEGRTDPYTAAEEIVEKEIGR